MQKRLRHYVWALVVLVLVVIAWPRAARFLAVDQCLDNGGRWDDATGGCDYIHPAD